MADSLLSDAVDISVSVISHAQIGLVAALLADLESQCHDTRFEVILTLNLAEELPFSPDSFSWPIKVIRNTTPMGFAANQNQACRHATGRYFCVVNPDIRLMGNPFAALVSYLKNPSVGMVAPLVLGTDGSLEDSARRFPSPAKIFQRVFLGDAGPDYSIRDVPVHPDWVGGMFMLYPLHIFNRLGGFDERYFLYYEDVDICARLRLLGYDVAVCPGAKVVHHAQRSSHKNLKYLRWHLKSMLRFFLSPVYRQVRLRPQS
jgi:N-acetylglucosaminyl-diphospho-decaprenol L-rhamnosyltransferase